MVYGALAAALAPADLALGRLERLHRLAEPPGDAALASLYLLACLADFHWFCPLHDHGVFHRLSLRDLLFP